MTLAKGDGFYWPWPRYGVHLSRQWDLIRSDTELLAAPTNAAVYDSTTGVLGRAALAGFEFGYEAFPNKFRIVFIEVGNEFHFQCNEGTSALPDWRTLFHTDCDDIDYPVFFDTSVSFLKDINLVGDFYGLNAAAPGDAGTVTVQDGTRTFISSTATISVSGDDFYLSKDSAGNPEINLKTQAQSAGITSVTFSDGVHTLEDDTLMVNPLHFYFSQDTAGHPMLNLKNDQFSYSEHFIDVPEQQITIDERVVSPMRIDAMTGRTTEGGVGVIISFNGTPLSWIGQGDGGILFFYPVQKTYIALSGNVAVGGERLTFDLADDSAENFSWTLAGTQ